MQIDSPETEWYYPLLKPYVHYIPMVANESWVNLEEVIGWAEHHQEEVAKIVENATAFATRYSVACLTFLFIVCKLAGSTTAFAVRCQNNDFTLSPP